jgi:hypothetical protein
MSIFNRTFMSLLALAWCAAMVTGLYLVWDQSRDIHVTGDFAHLNFDLIFDTQAEQILATIVICTLALPAFLLLAMEITPSASPVRYDSKRDQRYGALQAQNESLTKQLDEERRQRRDLEKDYGRERSYSRDEARRNAETVRSSADRPAGTEDRPAQRQRRWHLLPTRHP